MLSDGERAEEWEVGAGRGSSGVVTHARARAHRLLRPAGSQGDFPTRGRAGPLKPNRLWLQPALCRGEGEARVNNNRGQKQVRSGAVAGLLRTPGPRPPWPTGLLQAQRGSARRAPTRHRLPSRAKWEGSTGKVSTARSGLRPRTGHMCYPGRNGHPPPPAAARWNSCPTPLSHLFSTLHQLGT